MGELADTVKQNSVKWINYICSHAKCGAAPLQRFFLSRAIHYFAVIETDDMLIVLSVFRFRISIFPFFFCFAFLLFSRKPLHCINNTHIR